MPFTPPNELYQLVGITEAFSNNDASVQFANSNNGNSGFAGTEDFTYNPVTKTLKVPHIISDVSNGGGGGGVATVVGVMSFGGILTNNQHKIYFVSENIDVYLPESPAVGDRVELIDTRIDPTDQDIVYVVGWDNPGPPVEGDMNGNGAELNVPGFSVRFIWSGDTWLMR